jgi:hypothetical protein
LVHLWINLDNKFRWIQFYDNNKESTSETIPWYFLLLEIE